MKAGHDTKHDPALLYYILYLPLLSKFIFIVTEINLRSNLNNLPLSAKIAVFNTNFK